ncbi:furin-like protease 2 isoform X1 [Vanessa atalanta]|uniref:furin-like protease 2 isoform X1 n=1 Tax=Vanessa atalanta TaxID=42275 RepID=UPI001FCD4130|nr:furin-like protease 2 isoform X1 [Vanessa atalanta]XP_047532267.1 furin-like protease 2 isoform X1 [Vanessa atalanta]XP_047532268.1 furin-like protease 2 isoform X1 [Vanessa atalanta]XP_047532269.1 furin-like protease 2 isoform X1 [Vanessa atalanta]
MVLSWRALALLAALQVCASVRETTYHNHFAVHVPAGEKHVDDIARRHGYVNHGQIGALKGYYLLSHHNVQKRSTEPSHDHHQKLINEPEVKWFEQQREKRRIKRDYNPYETSLWSQLSRRQPSHRTRHRAITPSPFFPDPLFKEQWYLNGGAKDGLDMNVASAWQKGYTGKNVVVSILDDGIQTNHPDLAQNYDPLASTDINGNDDDPMPQDNGDNKHGTRCAGEVAAVAYNQYCGVGIAYNASVGGVRMLDGVVNDAVEARALGLNPDHIDIYSASWGPEDDGKTVDGPGPLARRAFIYGVTSGRRGKGSIFVWASGNGGRHTDSCNCDGYTNSIFTLSISSATQGGYKPWYLEECSSTLATTYSSGTPGHDKSVATVDMDGRLRADHICTVEHTGTSASAPLAAGICALALEANPDLTWRDMQYLVVLTSRSQPLEKENGWIVNGIKRKVSHKFGYGLMDATEMVNLAEQWVSVPPQHICKSQEINEDKPIESSYGYTLSVHMDVNGCSGTVNEVRYLEHVQCKISLRFFPRGNLRILLTSPMGTTSTLLFERPRDVISSNFDDWPFLSVHFWGERAEGKWTLQIVNAGNRHVNQPGILKKWQLIFYGTSTDPVKLRSKRPSPISPPYAFPTAADGYDSVGDSFYNTDAFTNYQNFPTLFAAGSDPEKAIASLDGHNVPSPHGENVLADSNDRRVMHECDPECDSQGCYGKGPTQCITCKHYRLDDACVSRCPPRSYANQGGVCWPCHESCETCVGPGQDSCLTCSPAHLLVADLGLCLQQCPDGYWEDSEASACRPCAAHCSTCSERADACTSCEHHLVLYNGTCSASCPPSTFENEDYLCAKCHPSCDTCIGAEETHCVTCLASNYILDGTCLSTCPSGYYSDKKRKECMKCPVGCASCLTTLCLTCNSNWELNKKGKCVAVGTDRCSSREFADGSQCTPCHSDCESCFGQTEANCLTCATPALLQNHKCISECSRGYYAEAGRCTRCMHGCADCVSRLNCTSCTGSLRLQSGACRTACAEGYYADRGTCSKCYLSCRTCIGPRRDQCASCPPGWRLAAGECHPECPQGFYQTDDGCRHCHHYCRECNGSGPLHCTSCPPRFMLDGGLCMECLGSQYMETSSGMCRACDESCRTCSGPGQYSCSGCSRPLRFDRLNNQCVRCCSERGIAANATALPDCCHCHPDTGECINSSVAGKRRIPEWSALHTAQSDATPHALASVVAAVAALAVTVFIVAMIVTQQMRRSQQPQSRSKGAYYSPLACTDEGDVTVLGSRTTFPVSEYEQEPLLEHST